jgi:trans-aconitate methyltransferase
VDAKEASRLIDAAVPPGAGTWADFGAGDGTFTRALAARLGPGGRIYAVDRDANALSAVRSAAGVELATVRADLEQSFALPGAEPETLDGLLLANALHFLRDTSGTLERLAGWLRLGGRVVLIEYDQRRASRWVPYPVHAAKLPGLFEAAGLTPPEIVARAESAFGGEMYVAVGRLNTRH